MQQEDEKQASRIVLLSEMQEELKDMHTVILHRLEDLEMQQEELRQYQMQVMRALATFRSLLEQEQKGHGG